MPMCIVVVDSAFRLGMMLESACRIGMKGKKPSSIWMSLSRPPRTSIRRSLIFPTVVRSVESESVSLPDSEVLSISTPALLSNGGL